MTTETLSLEDQAEINRAYYATAVKSIAEYERSYKWRKERNIYYEAQLDDPEGYAKYAKYTDLKGKLPNWFIENDLQLEETTDSEEISEST